MPLESTGPADACASPWVDRLEACRILGTSDGMFEYWMKHGPITSGRYASRPDGAPGRRVRVYDRAEIERLAETIRARRGVRAPVVLPEGCVDRAGAARMFGVSRCTWDGWVRLGKVPAGTVVATGGGRGGGDGLRRRVYTLDELHRIRAAMDTPDSGRPRRDPDRPGAYVLPAGMVRREEAWRLFGVGMPTWMRWERQGLIECGEVLDIAGGGRLKAYPLAELKRLLATFGRFAAPYADPERPGCVRVPLAGRGMRRREAIIDAADLTLIEAGTCSCGSGEQLRAGAFVSFNAPGASSVPLHRVITRVAGRAWQVGHLNGDPLDCRRANLVVRTVAQRSYTTRKRATVAGRPTTSRFKGVCWELWTKRWQAMIRCGGVTRRIGRFHDEINAAQAYDDAARELFGEHARLNFPDGVEARLAAEAAAAEAAVGDAAVGEAGAGEAETRAAA